VLIQPFQLPGCSNPQLRANFGISHGSASRYQMLAAHVLAWDAGTCRLPKRPQLLCPKKVASFWPGLEDFGARPSRSIAARRGSVQLLGRTDAMGLAMRHLSSRTLPLANG
jgi:hypothetical protein